MTHRLLVNPGTPQAWEILLKPGTNRIGRGDHNDFKITHGSVSGSHCEVVISSAGVLIKDLGSTNGTFVNRAPVHEALLHTGQHIQLGSVDMVFETVGTPAALAVETVVAPTVALSAPAAPAPVKPPPVRLSLSRPKAAPAAEAPAPAAAAVEEPPLPPPIAGPPAMLSIGPGRCQFHKKTPARFYCTKCRHYFCDLCVATRASTAGPKKTCRTCGTECVPVRVEIAKGGGSFYGKLPGAFIYPFKGFGPVFVFIAAVVFSALSFVGGGLFGILITAAAYGFLFLFMQNIIHSTTSDENEPLSLPSGGDLGGGFIALLGTILMSFWLLIGLFVVRYFDWFEVPGSAFIGATILGCLYCPMAILAVAMKDSPLAANPLVVFPAIMRMPLEYAVTAIVLLSAYGFYKIGDIVASAAGWTTMTTHSMTVLFAGLGFQALWKFITVYILAVSMRILALLYVCKKEKFGWFAH